MVITSQDLKSLTALLAGLAGVATAVGSCNQAAQERLKADNKIYTVLAEGQKQQAADLTAVHKQLDELRGYLEAIRPAAAPALPAPGAAPVGQLTPLHRFTMSPIAAAAPMPAVPAPAPAPILRPLPKFEDIAAAR